MYKRQIQITADNITIEFAEGSVLRGAVPMPATPDDKLAGIGIRIDTHKNVTIKGAVIGGFKCAIRAVRCDGLTLASCRVDRNVRQRLRSTPMAEDQSDWLRPHDNDAQEWFVRYGAAVLIEQSSDLTIRGLRVRNSQNGIVLDRVCRSRIYDCDCSFLSGWGLAMWRSSSNLISRNAFDFCIRGYSHGVYNRGQDSAGILCFEQCSHNLFIENSATHCGDGFFGFAGKEALGQTEPPSHEFTYTNRGCNNNTLARNDFSFAAAHGIEMTFSFDNRFINNRLFDNAICGVWAGYSQRTLIDDNNIERCGQPSSNPLAEGGGINIEHGARNIIVNNRFAANSAAIALWSDDDGALLTTPWALANHRGSENTIISHNLFTDEPRFLRVRRTTSTAVFGNTFINTASAPDSDVPIEIHADVPELQLPAPAPVPDPVGETQPVEKRVALAGRENIVMGPWGPWDHQSPMMRLASATSARAIFELYGDAGAVAVDVLAGKGDLETDLGTVEPDRPRTLVLRPRAGISVLPYKVRVTAQGIDETLSGTFIQTQWIATAFVFLADPISSLDAWRAESKAPGTVVVPCDDLGWMRFGRKPLRELPIFRESADRAPGNTNFGIIARTRLILPAGEWRFTTLSDDGVRIQIGDKTIIENWTHHAPERNEAVFTQAETAPVDITVEYFQLDGHATFELSIEKISVP